MAAWEEELLRKNFLIRWVGIALAASLVLAGCDTGGSSTGVVAGGGGGSVTGGGGGGGATTGFGLTGGTNNGGGGVGTTATGGTSTSTGTTTTTTTTTGGGGNRDFLGPVTETDLRTSLNNPTAYNQVNIGGVIETVILDGFRFGQASGRLLLLNQNANQGPDGFPIIQITPDAQSDITTLNNPFHMVSDGNALYISVGFGVQQDAAILRVDNFQDNGATVTATFTDITSQASFISNPLYMTLATNVSGVDYVYWTEYSSSQTTGRVRRVPVNGGAVPDVIIDNLNFPAGIDHDGFNLCVAVAGGGAGSNGTVILAPVDPGQTLNGETDVTIVTPQGSQQAIFRPWDVVFDSSTGFFFTEGFGISGTSGGPGPTGQGNGAVRYIPTGSSVAQLVSNGRTNCAGLSAFTLFPSDNAFVAFTENLPTNGTVQRRLVDVTNVTNTQPTVTDTGIFNPIFVDLLFPTGTLVPNVASIINFDGGQANGLFRLYELQP